MASKPKRLSKMAEKLDDNGNDPNVYTKAEVDEKVASAQLYALAFRK